MQWLFRLVAALSLLLTACSHNAPPPPAEPAKQPATVLDDQLKALEKAKAVESQLEQEKAATDRKIDAAESQ